MGNRNNSGLKINLFDSPLEVQYVRLVPIICRRGCTLRFELLGCELDGECQVALPSLKMAVPVPSFLSQGEELGGPGNKAQEPGLTQKDHPPLSSPAQLLHVLEAG